MQLILSILNCLATHCFSYYTLNYADQKLKNKIKNKNGKNKKKERESPGFRGGKSKLRYKEELEENINIKTILYLYTY